MKKQPYQSPELSDRGSIVTLTRQSAGGDRWDGIPYEDDDTRPSGLIIER